MTSSSSKEFILKTEHSYVRPDFLLKSKKIIIEFDGDYWHSLVVANPIREKVRDSNIEKQGYKILHIAEYKYNADKEKVIQECIDFLTK